MEVLVVVIVASTVLWCLQSDVLPIQSSDAVRELPPVLKLCSFEQPFFFSIGTLKRKNTIEIYDIMIYRKLCSLKNQYGNIQYIIKHTIYGYKNNALKILCPLHPRRFVSFQILIK